MKNKIFLQGLVSVTLLGGVVYQPVMAAQDMLTSPKLKQVRFLSRALIKSRANEKLILEQEMQSMRSSLQSLSETLQGLEDNQFKYVSQITITPPNSGSDFGGVLTIDGKVVSKPVPARTVSKQGSNKIFDADMKKALGKISAEKSGMQQVLSRSAKKSSKNKNAAAQREAKRNAQVMSLLEQVELELTKMRTKGSMNMTMVRSLKHSLTLTIPELAADDIEPTLHTMTKHRK